MSGTWLDRWALSKIKSDVSLRVDFYDVMADSASEGLAQLEVLNRLRKHLKPTDPLAVMIDRVQKRLRGTLKSASGAKMRTLGTELKGILPDDELAMIIGGESSGAIEKGWRNAGSFARRQRELKSAIIGALSMPAFYMLAFVGLLLFMSFYLLPQFEAGRPRDGWPAMAQMLGWVSDNILWIIGVGAIILFGFAAGFHWLNANWTGSNRAHADTRLPIFKSAAQIQGASFMMALASFMASGVSFGEALQRLQGTSTPYMRWQLRLIEASMRSGARPEDALLKCSLISAEYHWIISIYGMISATDASKAYERIANEMARRTQDAIKMIVGKVLGNAMLLLLGAGVMVVYFSLYGIVATGVNF